MELEGETGRTFPESLKALEEVCKMLACCKCGLVPERDVFMLGGCIHKYCESCMNLLAGKACAACRQMTMAKSVGKDTFTSDLLMSLKSLEKVIRMESQEHPKEHGSGLNESPDRVSLGMKENRKESEPTRRKSSLSRLKGLKQTPFRPPLKECSDGDSEELLLEDEATKCAGTLSDVDTSNPKKPTGGVKKSVLDDDDDDSDGDFVVIKNKTPRLSREKKPKKSLTSESFNDEQNSAKKEPNTKESLKKRMGKKANSDEELSMSDDLELEAVGNGENPPPFLTPYVKASTATKVYSRRRAVEAGTKMNVKKGVEIFDYDESMKDEIAASGSSPPPSLTPYGNRAVTSPPDEMNEIKDTPKTSTKPKRLILKAKKPKQIKEKVLSLPLPINIDDENSQKRAERQLKLSPLNIPTPPAAVHIPKLKTIKESTPTLLMKESPRVRRNSRASSVAGFNSPGSLMSTSFSSTSSVEKRNAKGETPLHIACKAGQVEKAKQLIIAGADANAQDNAGWTPLHEAINGKGDQECKLELVKLLCKDGSCNTNVPGMDNEFALHEAARGGLKDIVVHLLSHSASPNVRNQLGKLPRDVTDVEEIKSILQESSILRSPDGSNVSTVEDPVVLELQLSKALLYFNDNKDIQAKTLGLIKERLKLKIAKDLGVDVTHIVFSAQKDEGEAWKKVNFSLGYLHGIVNGAWMLSSKWIENSIAKNHVVSPTSYEIIGCSNMNFETDAPKRSRINKELGNPGLFHGMCFYFYKNTAFPQISKKHLTTLIKLADGQVVNREPTPESVDPLECPIRFHAKSNSHKLVLTSHIILYDEKNEPPAPKKHNMEHIKVLKIQWLIDSIGSFLLQDPDNYI